jgi:hypothetical protein
MKTFLKCAELSELANLVERGPISQHGAKDENKKHVL